MERRVKAATVALGVAVSAFVVANLLELAIVGWIKPTLPEFLEISDLVLAGIVGVTAFLWFDLKATRTEVQRLEREQIVVGAQLAAAAEIQRRLLPSEPRTIDCVTCAVRFEPAGQVGGDYYDFLPIAPDVLLVVIGDISGKGIPAAILLTLVRAVLRLAAARTSDPADLLTRLSDALFEDNHGSPYATCLIARVDVARGEVTYSNAGHPAGIIVGPGGPRSLDRGGLPVGMFENPHYVSHTLPYRPGDLAVFVTDGIAEVDVEDRPPEALLTSLVERVPAPRTPASVCDSIMTYARAATGPTGMEGWSDDRTVLAFEWKETTPARFV